MTIQFHHGDALDVLRGMEASTVDAVVTDPPAGIGFMEKEWDRAITTARIEHARQKPQQTALVAVPPSAPSARRRSTPRTDKARVDQLSLADLLGKTA